MKVLNYRSTKKLGDEHGQSLVELALMMPMLIALVVGIVDVGWMAYCYVELANAANAGVHYASQNVTTSADLGGIKTAFDADAKNLTAITPTVSYACTCSDGKTTITCTSFAACVVPYRIIDTVTVSASTSVSPPFKFPALPNSVTMKSSATMRIAN